MSRIRSVDVVRLLAILAVISIHTGPFCGTLSNYHLYTAINQGARFAVPFFFVMSGFFFKKKIQNSELVFLQTQRAVKRLGSMWLFYSFIYCHMTW